MLIMVISATISHLLNFLCVAFIPTDLCLLLGSPHPQVRRCMGAEPCLSLTCQASVVTTGDTDRGLTVRPECSERFTCINSLHPHEPPQRMVSLRFTVFSEQTVAAHLSQSHPHSPQGVSWYPDPPLLMEAITDSESCPQTIISNSF